MKRWINTRVVIDIHSGKVVEQHGFWYNGPLALATTPPTMEITNWAFYNDGTESGSVIIGSVNMNPTLDVDTIYFVRFGLEETSGNESKNEGPQLQYNLNGGGWNNVTDLSSVVRAAATANIADGDNTTQRITSFTFDTTNEGFDEVNGIAGGPTCDLINTGFEALFSFQILSADVTDDDTIVLKIVDSNDGDADYDIYNQIDPTIIVSEEVGYSITCESGSYALTGQDVGLPVGHKLAIDSGTFSLIGTGIGLKTSRKLSVGVGNYAIDGQAVGLKRGYPLVVGSGVYSLSGQAIGLKAGRKLSIEVGSYILIGQDVTLTYTPVVGYSINIESGIYAVNGQSINLKAGRKLSIEAGSYILDGQAIGLKKGYKILISGGSYVLTGQDITLLRNAVLNLEAGNYNITGQDISLIHATTAAGLCATIFIGKKPDMTFESKQPGMTFKSKKPKVIFRG